MSASNEPKISVVIPVFNRAKFIAETIESVLKQEMKEWELILVDDGSSDDSISICKSFTEIDQRIRLIQRKENPKGASVCRNIGIANAKSDWIIFLDSDDLLAPWCLIQRWNIIKNNLLQFDFAVFPMLYFKLVFDDMRILQNINTEINPLDRFLQRENVWLMSSVIWSKYFLKSINGYRQEAMSFQDWEINVRALIGTDRWKFFDDLVPDNFYRQHNEMISVERFTLEHTTSNLDNFIYCFEALKRSKKYSEERRLYFGALIFEWLRRFSGIPMKKRKRENIRKKYLQRCFLEGIFNQMEKENITFFYKISDHPLVVRLPVASKLIKIISLNFLPISYFDVIEKQQGKNIYKGLLTYTE